jgi:enoyl-CoA hydratase/carnithine racemase
MANLRANSAKALTMGLVHEVYPDETFEEEVMNFCRHLAKQNPEQMGTAKLAIEMAKDVGLAQARNVERLANSSLMLNPAYLEGMAKYVQGIGKGGKKD